MEVGLMDMEGSDVRGLEDGTRVGMDVIVEGQRLGRLVGVGLAVGEEVVGEQVMDLWDGIIEGWAVVGLMVSILDIGGLDGVLEGFRVRYMEEIIVGGTVGVVVKARGS